MSQAPAGRHSALHFTSRSHHSLSIFRTPLSAPLLYNLPCSASGSSSLSSHPHPHHYTPPATTNNALLHSRRRPSQRLRALWRLSCQRRCCLSLSVSVFLALYHRAALPARRSQTQGGAPAPASPCQLRYELFLPRLGGAGEGSGIGHGCGTFASAPGILRARVRLRAGDAGKRRGAHAPGLLIMSHLLSSRLFVSSDLIPIFAFLVFLLLCICL
ncbi:hypothetical protein C8F01DRAFT_448832 [Mycena amicta]|nr:hypothetical protein C8F01DRAFT_448832 [Mycena amicta]